MSKFFDSTDEYVWNLSLDGGCEEEYGASHLGAEEGEGTWYGLNWGCPLPEGDQLRKDMLDETWKDVSFDEMRKCTAGWIMSEDNDGFITVHYYSNQSEMIVKWKEFTGRDVSAPQGVNP